LSVTRTHFGPTCTFGVDIDLCLGNSSNGLRNAYTVLNNAYELPAGASNTFLTGKNRFDKIHSH